MKRAPLVSAIVVVGLTIAGLWAALRAPVGLPAAPSFVLPDLTGKVVRMDDLRGKVVVLNLWATWCKPCIEEMPTLDALARKMGGRDFVLLAISEDENPQNVRPWIEERGLAFPVLLDEHANVGAALGITGYPETFIVDRTGRIVHHHVGYRDWSTPEMVAALERLMETGEWRIAP